MQASYISDIYMKGKKNKKQNNTPKGTTKTVEGSEFKVEVLSVHQMAER